MSDQPKFDYYYGLEAESFRFIRIPKLIIEDKVFYELSDRAKILYGVMLDRMCISRENNWLDDQNRVYILFSIKNIAKALNCSITTACKTLAELDSEKGIGLVEKVKRGQGNPDIIYVKNFTSYVDSKPEVGQEKAWDSSIAEECYTDSDENSDDETGDELIDQEENVAVSEGDIAAESQNVKIQNSRIQNSKIQNSKILNSKILNSKNCNSRIQKSLSLEFQNLESNNTNINDTEINDTKADNDGYDRWNESARVISQIQQNICYDVLSRCFDPDKKAVYEEIYQLICDVVLVPDDSLKINGKQYPYELVRQRFMSLTIDHVEYVVSCMEENFTPVTNMRSYLISALYNAPLTIKNHLDQQFRADTHEKVTTRYDLECSQKLQKMREEGILKSYS